VSGIEVTRQTEIHNLYNNHHRWLRAWIRSRFDCSETAADLAQDTFIRILQKETIPQPQSPRPYLSSIARNLLIDLFRRRSIERAYLDTLALQPEAVHISPEARHTIIETLVQIDSLLDDMGERPREVFLLAQIDGLSFVAISRRLGISVNTVRKHFIRAMSQCLLLVGDD